MVEAARCGVIYNRCSLAITVYWKSTYIADGVGAEMPNVSRKLSILVVILAIVIGIVSLVKGDWLNVGLAFVLGFPWGLELISQRFAPQLTRGMLGRAIWIAYIVVTIVVIYYQFFRPAQA